MRMMFDAIMVGCGVLWTLAYLLIIRQGFLDRTYGISFKLSPSTGYLLPQLYGATLPGGT